MRGSDLQTNEQKQRYIRALLFEREGYAKAGRDADVAAVDAQLKAMGHDAKPPSQRATKMERKPADVKLAKKADAGGDN